MMRRDGDGGWRQRLELESLKEERRGDERYRLRVEVEAFRKQRRGEFVGHVSDERCAVLCCALLRFASPRLALRRGKDVLERRKDVGR